MSPVKDKFTFEIVGHSPTSVPGEMPKHFLADTIQEAERVYKNFSSLLNLLAFNFSMTTGLPKADLFGEGLIGLGQAHKDWDGSRSKNFRTYAIFRIKDSMMEFVRANKATIKIPSYIRKSMMALQKLKETCEEFNLDYREVIEEMPWEAGLPEKSFGRIGAAAALIHTYAKNAGVKDVLDFVDRLENVPEEVSFADQAPFENSAREQQILEAALIVEQMKPHLDEIELAICEGIMADKSYAEIGNELGHGKSWVAERVFKIREKMKKVLV